MAKNDTQAAAVESGATICIEVCEPRGVSLPVPGHASDLLPGENDVDVAVWERALGHEPKGVGGKALPNPLKRLLDDGILRVRGNRKARPILESTAAMNEAEAGAAVAAQDNVDTLKAWAKDERRGDVKRQIKGRIEEIERRAEAKKRAAKAG